MVQVDLHRSNAQGQTVREVAYKTVEALAGITQRKLWLVNATEPCTDGNKISAPLRNPNVVLVVENLLAHVLFKTNQESIYQFCSMYAAKIETTCAASNVPFPKEAQAALRELLLQLGNVLEARRVSSLWGKVYEGSSSAIKSMKKAAAVQFADEAHDSIVILAALLEAGVPIGEGKLDILIPPLQEALGSVEGRGPQATLIVLKRLVYTLITSIVEASPSSRPDAMMKLLGMGGKAVPGPLSGPYNQVKSSNLSDFANSFAKKEALQALNTPINQDLTPLLEASSEEMNKEIQKAKSGGGLADGSGSPDQWISKDAKAKVIFHDISYEETAAYAQTKNIKTTFSEDTGTIRHLRDIFARVTSKRRTDIYSSGLVVDPMAFIQYKLSGTTRPVFRDTTSGRGFEALILMDRSSSLGGALKRQVERACRILAGALNYPFVELKVWGFNASAVGQIDIYRFVPNSPCYESASAGVGGFTPIHIAAHLGIKALELSRATKHMFMITDGVPNHHTKDGVVDRELINKITANEIVRARTRGIGVTGAIIPKIKKGEIDRTNRPYMDIMFGRRGDWNYLSPDNIGSDLIQLVVKSFIAYLQKA